MTDLRLNFYSTPGHGYLALPIEEMPPTLLPQISNCSYFDRANFYLEEDLDAVVILQYFDRLGRKVHVLAQDADDNFLDGKMSISDRLREGFAKVLS